MDRPSRSKATGLAPDLAPLPRHAASRRPVAARDDPDDVPLAFDLARCELYRLLDALARVRSGAHAVLVREFELAWHRYREETAIRSRAR